MNFWLFEGVWVALQYNHTEQVLLPSYLLTYINLHIKYGSSSMRIFKLKRGRPQPCRVRATTTKPYYEPPPPPPRSTFVNVINYSQLSLHIDVTCILNMYSMIFGSSHISYGNMCFKVFLNIYAEVVFCFGGG